MFQTTSHIIPYKSQFLKYFDLREKKTPQISLVKADVSGPVEHQSKNPWLLRIWRNTPWLEVSIVIGVPQMDELFHGKS